MRQSRLSRNRWQRAIGALALVFVSGPIAACERRPQNGPDEYRGRVLPEPIEKFDFTLDDTEGQPFNFIEETEGRVTLVFFGYTNCPDVCPIHMANIAAVMRDFPFDLKQQFRVVFISTDPERDTPERIREWLDNFDPSFLGLRGSVEEVNDIAARMGVPPAQRVEVETGDYLVGHSASVIAFTRDDMAHLMYPFGTRQADWAHDLPRLATETWDE
ncbi:MAG: SCO family protein [Gemmatimonadetes bacterium]|uniref:SCO family protein n=1 Tax=Candidatus Kutchimonas denitrificans TaxID=3056748 RepID=A0AAE5CB39_9BACT|nr:SCO family protein [Gemmatimonadota bacterium]NIR74010.1 SCO family protein [Candidatus Kutchimonas denitrificans]NIS02999.1 SCO family protein [Gemmatimonadota bacterium]NIT68716.1 SCO family protein [Gemmatimonadota bacterium]NIU53297.1 redoxin domain-containing protein [Gemmatimonadota bacterium]